MRYATRPVPLALAAVLAVASLPLFATAASACDGKLVVGGDGTTECVVSTPGDGPGDATGTGTSWSPPEGYVLIEWRSQGSEDGEPCTQVNREWVPQEDADDLQYSYALALHRWLEAQATNGYNQVPDCTVEAGDPVPSAAMVREILRGQLPLPEPDLHPRERTLPGLRTYLQVGAPTSYDATLTGTAVPVALSVSGTAEYRVDWGDGTVETYASAGGPYPTGDVTHVYEDAGEATVTVTPVWTATWSVGGSAPMTLPPIELLDAQLQLPITEIRSVRTR